MTGKLFLEDAYCRSASGVVTALLPGGVVLGPIALLRPQRRPARR